MSKRNKRMPASPGIPLQVIDLPVELPTAGVASRIGKQQAKITCRSCCASLICETFGRNLHGVRRVFACRLCGEKVLHLNKITDEVIEVAVNPGCMYLISYNHPTNLSFFYQCHCLACCQKADGERGNKERNE